MQPGIIALNAAGKLGKPGQQHPHAGIHMNEKGHPPMNDMNVLLLYTQKAHIGIVGNICHRDPCHQEHKECEGNKQGCIEDIGAADNLFYF